jgi:hypothetical protein
VAAGPTGTPSKMTASTTNEPASGFNDEVYGGEHSRTHPLHRDEEPAVSGWGGDEDEDGMGML